MEAKERRDNERRDRGLGRGVGSRWGRNGRGTQLAAENGGRNGRGTQLAAEIPPPQPANQLEDRGVLASNLAGVAPTNSSTTLASSSNLAGRGGREGRSGRGGRSARGIELAEIIPSPPPTNQQEDQGVLARDLARVVSTTSSTTLASSSNLAGRGGRGGRNARGTELMELPEPN